MHSILIFYAAEGWVMTDWGNNENCNMLNTLQLMSMILSNKYKKLVDSDNIPLYTFNELPENILLAKIWLYADDTSSIIKSEQTLQCIRKNPLVATKIRYDANKLKIK